MRSSARTRRGSARRRARVTAAPRRAPPPNTPGRRTPARCAGRQRFRPNPWVAPWAGPGRVQAKGRLLPEVLEVLAGLEADRASGGDLHFLARPRVPADSALARLDLEDAEPPQLDPFPTHHGVLHRLED